MWWGRLVLIGAAATHPATAQPQQTHETVVVQGSPSCSTEQADGSRALAFDCLNAQLADGDAPHTPDLKAVAAAGRGNPEALGTFSYTATKIRMGSAFGHSVKPERPAPTSYTMPLVSKGK